MSVFELLYLVAGVSLGGLLAEAWVSQLSVKSKFKVWFIRSLIYSCVVVGILLTTID